MTWPPSLRLLGSGALLGCAQCRVGIDPTQERGIEVGVEAMPEEDYEVGEKVENFPWGDEGERSCYATDGEINKNGDER